MKYLSTLVTLVVATVLGACTNMPPSSVTAPVATAKPALAAPAASSSQSVATASVATAKPALAAPAAQSTVLSKTTMASSTTIITATRDPATGNAIIGWPDSLPVMAVEHYIGHGGAASGRTKVINVTSGTSQVVLADVVKNGGRFGLVMKGSSYLHIECGGNANTSEASLRGISKDCTERDPATGQLVGALVINK